MSSDCFYEINFVSQEKIRKDKRKDILKKSVMSLLIIIVLMLIYFYFFNV